MLHLFGFEFVQNCEIYLLSIVFVANFGTCPSASRLLPQTMSTQKTCLHSDGLSPSTAHKSNKLRAHEPAATSRGPPDTLQKPLISRMCSLTFVLLCAGIMFLYSAPMQTCSRLNTPTSLENRNRLGGGGDQEQGFWL